MSTAPKPFFAYRSFVPAVETKERFAQMGFRQFCVFPANTVNSMGGLYSQYGQLWKYRKVYDFSALDKQIEEILAFAPDGQFICMIDLNTPLWLTRRLQGDSFSDLSRVIALPEWRELTKEYLTDFLEYSQSRYGEKIIAYVLACGNTDEWMDYSCGVESAAKLQRCRDYAVAHGMTAPAAIPDWEKRFRSTDGLRDPQEDAAAIEYWKIHSGLTAEAILDMAQHVRQQLLPAQQLGVFYGYILQLTWQRLVECGHLAYEKVLEDGAVDFLISPGDYYDRQCGGAGGFMIPNGTIHRHGRGYLHEVDHVTHTGCIKANDFEDLNWVCRWKDAAEDIAGLRREFCRTLLHGASMWLFDMWGEFYADPQVQQAIQQLLQIHQRLADGQRQPDGEMIILVDPENAVYIDDRAPGSILPEIYIKTAIAVNHVGASVRYYSFEDLEVMPPCQLLLPVGLFHLSAEKLERFQRYAQQCGAVLAIQSPALEELYPSLPLAETDAAALRKAAEEAGVRCYGQLGDVVLKSQELLSIHSAQGGLRQIPVGEEYVSAVELFSGRTHTIQSGRLEITLNSPDTQLFQLQKEVAQ